ncbi:Cupin domain-containing protein [Sinosporangium album]|uniref:Cupin domain-containing protein n=1 Tax=Sinosporangium album TaxID=504805 RepID=A0A1G8FPJ3_9ACTN|nr:cupin domain-containing protein [Sinosporangium album]SDH84092.1 Cupin domain-containing protein [Sinosporangium album]
MQEEKGTPRLFAWADQVAGLSWTGLHRDDEWGWHRGRTPAVEVTNARTGVVVLPLGQASPPHVKDADVVIIGLDGVIDFLVDGEKFRVGERDFLTVPAGCVYSYKNAGMGNASFVGIIIRTDAWPSTNQYLNEAGEVVA